MTSRKATPTDLSSLRVVELSERGADLDLMGPFAPPTPIGTKLRIIGFDAQVVTKAARDFDRALAESPDEIDKTTAFEDRQLAIAKAALVGWDILIENGKEIEFSEAERDRFLSDPNYRHWVVPQIYKFGRDRANFRQRPEGS